MKVRVDQDKCISCALCIESCPEVFEWDTNEKAKEKMDLVPPDLEEKVKEASSNCPTEAISIEENKTSAK